MRGFLHMLFAIVAGVAVGWITAVSLIEHYGFEASVASPQWKERRNATEHPAAPYAFGYFINQGQVPPPLSARHYVRDTDSEGNALRGDCIYVLEGHIPKARRWSMAILTSDGVLSTLGAGEAVSEQDGTMRVWLAPYPVPGNRLVMPGSGAPRLTLTIHDPAPQQGAKVAPLPELRRERC
jgi:hypothetical protein